VSLRLCTALTDHPRDEGYAGMLGVSKYENEY